MPTPFETILDRTDEPNWEPLERVSLLARQSLSLPSFHPGEFMLMGRLAAPGGVRIHLFKHVDTRRYINLDEQGHAYEYCGSLPEPTGRSGGWYRQHLSLADAIAGLRLDQFEGATPYFRSFPPEEWPPDPAFSDRDFSDTGFEKPG